MSKFGLFLGRFQPLHDGHMFAISTAAAQVEKLLILIGSANQCRSIKNPWSYKERKEKLLSQLSAKGITNVEIAPVNDYPYSDSQWITDVRATVEHFAQGETPVLFGHFKAGNEYLFLFPDWKFVPIESAVDINATGIREEMFQSDDNAMPDTVKQDWQYYQKEAKTFADYPFPETLNFNCGDVVLECQGHILLIQRLRAPGAGQWALPGGFKNSNETFLDCAIRELKEETNVRVPEKIIRGSIIKTQLFDSPTRSFGIPRNTLAVYIRINPNPDGSLPRANGADDAAKCRWFTLTTVLNSLELYDDHLHIVSTMTGVVPMPAFLTRA